MEHKISELKNIKDDFYTCFTIYYEDGEEDIFHENSYETISVGIENGKKCLHVGDYVMGLWNFYEDGTCDKWFHHHQTIREKTVIGFDIY